MGKLQVLSPSIANMIAAGEVVQRPASVVKELVENAVDAGADKISVIIADSGRTMVQVIDNGCGMSPEDAVLCFERHATSKIASAEDLSRIMTYGFRGEALASIAAVSEVTLRTRRAGDEAASQVSISDFGKVDVSQCSAPVGTSIAVRNLFYNTPARRKFLKSDSAEFRHIVEEFTRIALTRPDVAFTLTHNGKDVFVLKKAKSLKFRVQDLLGATVAGDIVDLDSETSVVKVSGFLGRPDAARKSLGNQFFFVNGRFFRSAYLHKAVMKAYEEMTPQGLTPTYVIFLETDPGSIDVNIHPTKTEIKFEDDGVFFQILYACVRETLGRNSFGAGIDFDTEGAVDLPNLGRSFEQYSSRPAAPVATFDPTYDPFESGPSPAGLDFPGFEGAGMPPADSSRPAPSYHLPQREDYGVLFEEKTLPSTQTLVLQGKYVVVPVASGVMVLNIRRARERIFYERALKALTRQRHVTQTALFPVEVEVGVSQKLLFDEHAELLSSLGFDITPSGETSLTVGGVPEGFSCEAGKVVQMVQDLALVLADEGGCLPQTLSSAMAQKFATLGASGADAVTSPLEAQRLIDALFACDSAELTPSGRRTVVIIPIDEIENKFN